MAAQRSIFATLACLTQASDDSSTFGKYDFYHSTDAIEQELSNINCEGYSFEDVRDQEDGEVGLPVVRLEQLGDKDKSEAMMVFGEHPRELISPEVGLNLVRTLCSNAGKEARQTRAFTFVINANPEGRRKIEGTNDWCVRTNEHDVDLNRNYAQGWQQQQTGQKETGIGIKVGRKFEMWSSGDRAFSEPETRIVQKLVKERKPHVFVDVHSGTQALILPWAYTTDGIEDHLEQDRMMKVGHDLFQYCPDCTLGPGAATIGYKATGTASDYAFGQGVPYSFTTEIYAGGNYAHADHIDRTIYEAKKKVAESNGDDMSHATQGVMDDNLEEAEDTSASAEALLKSADMDAQDEEKKRRSKQLEFLHVRGRASRRSREEPTSLSADASEMSEFLKKANRATDEHESSFSADAADLSELSKEANQANDDRTSECFQKFNPSTKDEYDEVVGRWTKGLLRLNSAVVEVDSTVTLPNKD